MSTLRKDKRVIPHQMIQVAPLFEYDEIWYAISTDG